MSDDDATIIPFHLRGESPAPTAMELALRSDHPSALGALTPAEVAASLDGLRALLLRAYDNVDLDAYDGDVLAPLDKGLEHAASDIRTWRKAIAARLVECVPGKGKRRRQWGDYIVEVTASKPRRGWESERLLADVIGAALRKTPTEQIVDRDTGEVVEQWNQRDLIENIAIAVLACAPLTASTQWRVTALRDYDLKPGDYCDEAEEYEHTAKVIGGGQ